ncbi:MAG: Rrf2 family transcriptional regulator [Proteobacteria bacterium]|nr:Rrf2 family transcriptional regulator [Pseudomonadota bacterium]
MRLTSFSDYAFRLLMMADAAGDRLITIEEAAKRYRISRAHLMKVANQLTRTGFLEAVRGRSGGLQLARPASEIRIGDVIRSTEPDFGLVECFLTGNTCVITGYCRLPRILNEALDAFISTMNRYTLADISLTKVNVLLPSEPQLTAP